MGSPPQSATPLTINQKVIAWARGKLGQQVGKGECWDLAERALKSAGAQTSYDLGSVDPDSDYVWGDPVDQLKDIEPGDVLQFRDHEVRTLTETTITFSDGTIVTKTTEETAERGHHTAIATSMLDGDGKLSTLDQHVKPLGKVVQRKVLYTRDVGPVEKTTTERRKHPETKKLETATVVTTVTIEVSGTISAFRPKPK